MYYLDSLRDKDGSEIYRTKAGFRYPLSKDRNGQYKVKSGEMIRVCMTSDFFLEEADAWREEAWDIIRTGMIKADFYSARNIYIHNNIIAKINAYTRILFTVSSKAQF